MRDEPSRKQPGIAPLNFLFVASKVPNGDDEFDIIEEQIDKFRTVFGLPVDDEVFIDDDETISSL